MKLIKNLFVIKFIIIFSIFFLDRISKIYILDFFDKNQIQEIAIFSFLNFYLIWNEGIAFGLFSFYQDNLYNILTVIILIIILIILFFLIKAEGLKKYALLMVFGGAIGNLFDRIFYKAVPDFIDFHVGNFHWFIFNVSDIFITMGVIFLIFLEFVDNKGIN
mgnify:CR=1 FL=1